MVIENLATLPSSYSVSCFLHKGQNSQQGNDVNLKMTVKHLTLGLGSGPGVQACVGLYAQVASA